MSMATDHVAAAVPQTGAPADPRARVGAALVLVLALAGLNGLAAAAVAAALALLLALRIGPGRRALLHRLAHVEGVVLVLFILLPFTIPGRPVLSLGPLSASAEGLARAALIALKVNAAALVLFALVAGLGPARLGQALAAFGLPAPLLRLFLLTARQLTVVTEETRRLSAAMRARGFVPRTDPHSWRSYGNLLGMLLLRALDRAARTEEAMRARGDAGRMAAAALPPMGRGDRAGLALAVTAAVALTVADRLA